MYNYNDLSNAVVRQAAEDYQWVLCKTKGKAWKKRFERIGNDSQKTLEEFFTGEDLLAFTNIDGRKLLHLLRREVKKCNHDIEEVRKLHTENRCRRKRVEAS